MGYRSNSPCHNCDIREEGEKEIKEVKMTGIGVFPALPSPKRISNSHCDDWVDRLSHGFTTFIILVCAILISTAHYVGPPIRCWIPAELDVQDPDSNQPFEHYIHNYCWMMNTYFIPMTESIPTDIAKRKEEEITYYQWVPIILLIQAFLFKLTYLIWRLSHTASGINISRLTKLADLSQSSTIEHRQNAIDLVVRELDAWIYKNTHSTQSVLGKTKATILHMLCFFCNKSRGTFLVALYLFVKILYLANVLGQIFLLNAFITTDKSMYGLEWLKSFRNGQIDVESRRFPRVTLCDLLIRQLNNIQRYTVQCVLPINLFNEKIFLTLWFWFIFLALLTCYNFLRWVYIVFLSLNKYQFAKKYLKIAQLARKHEVKCLEVDKTMCRKFAETYLRHDGCFVIRIIAMNTSDAVACHIVEELYKKWLTRVKPHTSEVEFNENNASGDNRNHDKGNSVRKRHRNENAAS